MSVRRLRPIVIAAGLVACVATLGAWAGGGVHVSRAGGGHAPIAGRAWVVKLVVRPSSFSGAVQVVAMGPQRLSVRATGTKGSYRARLVFPKPGLWTLSARAGGSRSSLGSVRVRPSPPLTLSEPTGIEVRPDGSLLVVEFGLRRLVLVAPATGRVTQVATFAKPWGVAQGSSGSVFVSDQGSLMRLDATGEPTGIVTADPGIEIGPVAVAAGGDVFYATARALYRVPQGGPATPQRLAGDTTFDSPHGIAIAADGAVLVSDTNNSRILRIDLSGGPVTTFAALGHPRGIDVGRDGTVYVAGADERRVVHLSASGQRLGVVGPAFRDPYALALAPDGSVYALEAGSQGVIRRIGPDGASSVVTAR